MVGVFCGDDREESKGEGMGGLGMVGILKNSSKLCIVLYFYCICILLTNIFISFIFILNYHEIETLYIIHLHTPH